MHAPPHPAITPESLGAIVDAAREHTPLTQCVTNVVVSGFTANVLLALGASPAMVDSIEEGPIFADSADGLLINVGTLNERSRDAALAITAARREADKSWCLDPVAVGALPMRTRLARDVLSRRPDVIRGNASEIIGLDGDPNAAGAGRGVDAGDDVEVALAAARRLAESTGGAVAVSGASDAIVTAERPDPLRLTNGHPMMTKVTGVGCALGAVVAAYLPVAGNPLLAAAAATAALTVAADDAATWASGPGSFAVELLDALGRLDGESVVENVVLS